MTVWENVRNYVLSQGFQMLSRAAEEEKAAGELLVYYSNQAAGLFIVIVAQEPMLEGITTEQYRRTKREVSEELFRRYQRMPVALGIICTGQPNEYREWCADGQTWLVETAGGSVILYENQIARFLGWEHSLEKAIQAIPARQAAQQSSANQGGWSGGRYYRSFPMITVILLVLNVLVFSTTELFLSEERMTAVYSIGALYWPAVIERGEFYRLVTATFLHFGSAHLMNNMLILFVIGSRLEDTIGKWKFLIIYFASGIVAGIASIGYNMLQNRIVVSAGASGAIFGLVGAMIWIVIAGRGKVQGLSVRQMMIFAALSLYGGFVNQQTDNAAHLGGMVGGFLFAMLLYHPRKRRSQEGGRI